MIFATDEYGRHDELEELVKEANQYEKNGREIIALSSKIKRMATDLYKKKEKIQKIKTSSLYQNLKYITKKQKDYVNWAIKDTLDNITKKKARTVELNRAIGELNALLEQRDKKVAKLKNMPKRRVEDLKENALLTHDERILDDPPPAKVRKDDDWDPDNFN